MSKRDPQPIPEEILDRSISLLEDKIGPRVERLMKSRLFLVPVGLSIKISTKLIAKAMGRPRVSHPNHD